MIKVWNVPKGDTGARQAELSPSRVIPTLSPKEVRQGASVKTTEEKEMGMRLSGEDSSLSLKKPGKGDFSGRNQRNKHPSLNCLSLHLEL